MAIREIALAKKEDLADKQDKLISGENIKTINGESLLGSGDIVTLSREDVIAIIEEYLPKEEEEVNNE